MVSEVWVAVDYDDFGSYIEGVYLDIDDLINYMNSTGNYKDIQLELLPREFKYVTYECSFININAGVRRSFSVMRVSVGETYFLGKEQH